MFPCGSETKEGRRTWNFRLMYRCRLCHRAAMNYFPLSWSFLFQPVCPLYSYVRTNKCSSTYLSMPAFTSDLDHFRLVRDQAVRNLCVNQAVL